MCGLLSKAAQDVSSQCSRCGSHLRARKPHSLVRTAAFLLAAYILYIPANVLPLMETGSLLGTETKTIVSGVVYLWRSGSWLLAAVVFIASVVVPLLKLFALTVLVISAWCRSTWQLQQRTKLYRIVELVGRWSMLDVYVVAVLVALVQFQPLATISAGPGAAAFAAVVVLSMLSAMAFDPRLIWDPLNEEQRSDA